MSIFLASSIGKKLFMSITGLFLVTFLLVHLVLNLLLLFDETGELFNVAANFMATNTFMHILEPVLALGLILHIIYATYITLQNQKSRPVAYKTVNQKDSSSWASRNMYILGGLVFVFLVIHIINFFYKIKFGEISSVEIDGIEMHNSYELVSGLFGYWYFSAIYIIGAILLGLHLSHGFWSGFQTLGLSNDIWRKRLNVIGKFYAVIIAFGFAIIPLFFLIKSNI
jgi:succinate dehydrogenase / fumarate reductase, cytochrome b subunit